MTRTGFTPAPGAKESEVLKKDGSVALTANWLAGNYQIKAFSFYGNVAPGIAPFFCDSDTKCINLNADLLDGAHVGIANTNVPPIDSATVVDNDYAKFTAAGLEGRSFAGVLADLSGQAAAAFSFNDKEITNAILNAMVAKGIWTASGIWTLPAFTLGGNVTVNAKKLDCGAGTLEIETTGPDVGLQFICVNDGAVGGSVYIYHKSASPDAWDIVGHFKFHGNNDATPAVDKTYAYSRGIAVDVSAGGEDGRYDWLLISAGADNLAMYLDGVGTLSIDASGVGAAAQVDEFDEYDDVALLQTVRRGSTFDKLCEIGVMERKDSVRHGDPSGRGGHFLKLQPFLYLLAGAIRQTEQRVRNLENDNRLLREQLERRFLSEPA